MARRSTGRAVLGVRSRGVRFLLGHSQTIGRKAKTLKPSKHSGPYSA